jgi:hypothetical protein
MNPLRKACLAGGFTLCFFPGGWIWWRGSYQEYLSSVHWETWPLFASVAVILTWIIGIRVIPTGLVVGSSFPAIVLTRVFVVDSDPTSHNLWPFEVAGALLFGMMMAFPPAGLGWFLRCITNLALGYLSKKNKASQVS